MDRNTQLRGNETLKELASAVSYGALLVCGKGTVSAIAE